MVLSQGHLIYPRGGIEDIQSSAYIYNDIHTDADKRDYNKHQQ